MKTLKSWKLNRNEVALSCGKNSGTSIKVYSARIIPLVKFGKPKEKTVAINKTCFINASKCKPSLSSKVTVRNYLIYPVSGDVSLSTIKHKTKLTLRVPSETNVDDITVTQ